MTMQDKIQAAISLTESWQSNAALNKERARETGDDAVFDNAQRHLDVYETILEALRVYAAVQWRPIETATKKIPDGFIRAYSFAPNVNESRPYASLPRAFKFEKIMGYRELDLYIDMPIPAEIVRQAQAGE